MTSKRWISSMCGGFECGTGHERGWKKVEQLII